MESPHGAAVAVDGFGLKGPRGWAFRAVGIEAAPGSLVVIEGPSGSGRTCLLLALTGRMRPTEGRAEVGGLELPRRMAAVRRISALGPVQGVSDLDPALTVAEHIRERALLQRRFDGSLRALLRPRAERAAEARGRVDRALEMAGLDLAALPKQERTAVRDLERLEELRLSVALALIGRPRLLAVDDMDLKLSDADRAEAWALLRSVAGGGTTVLAVCSQAPQDATVVRTTPAQAGDGSGAAGSPAEKPSPTPVTTRAAAADGSAEAAADTPGADASPAADGDAQAHAGEPSDRAQAGDAGEPAEATHADEDRTATHAAEAMPRGDHEDTTEEGAADALAETGRA
ncbi:ATP-binding cassette domain-containing protein [Streptomyces sp. PKU-EA00015]|uniref:ATP-binding cassette domain-containing protein n=1 Tax=Streptomyces sp. PKU-EA00015 TaxID=2748326 RepID=UPI0015A0F670|nr:ATP-binding cassette domain-containing protein [Streptomyces sp. PKU-EA00015]NWF30311.1 ATP-binding cassette domain-containing protein [Streptomyces sp. PKU-EA00015]